MDPIHPFDSEIKTTGMGFCYNIFGSTARQVIPFRKSRGKKRDQINKEKKKKQRKLALKHNC